MEPATTRVLLTGATGYVGGMLLPVLEREGFRVRCLARSPQKITPMQRETEVVRGDLLDPKSVATALVGTDTAVYLAHALGSSGSFADEERQAATTFAAAAAEHGLRRIVYLGGIGRGTQLSPHLESRQEVGRILRDSGVSTVELRASIVIGRGSASFDAIRLLIDTLPAVVLPSWARTLAQPIAVDDVVEYLRQALTLDLDGSAVFEIGGSDRVPYTEIFDEYARQTGHGRRVRTLPAPPPLVSAEDVPLGPLASLVPDRARLVSRLLESLRFETTVSDDAAARAFDLRPLGLRDAVAAVLAPTPAAA